MLVQQNEETKPPLVKKEEPDPVEPKQEKMETEEKKPEIKTEPKEEEDGGANGSSAASAAQNRKKGEKTRNVSGVNQSAADASSHRLVLSYFSLQFSSRRSSGKRSCPHWRPSTGKIQNHCPSDSL